MSAPLTKAILVRLKQIKGSGRNAPTRVMPEENGAFEVQFNPTSLKISRQNNVDEGGSTTRTQKRQNPSSQSATLTFDLEFDTAEGDGGREPVDVRTKTMIVRQFAQPTKEKPKDPPPPVRFIWGTFTFTGIVTQVTEDIDYFSPDGKPLRAKVAVTIKEQDPDFEAKLVGSAARDAQAATPPGGGSGSGPGSPPASDPTSAATAQGGESLQQLLTRLGADPATWRAAMAGLESPIGLAAGAQVQLGAGVSAGVGLGVSAGFSAGVGVSATASLGAALGFSAGAGAGFSAGAGAGFSAGVGAGFSAGAGAGAGFSAGAGAGFSAGAGAGFSAGGGLVAGAGARASAGFSVGAGFAIAEGGGVVASYNRVVSARADAFVAGARAEFSVPGLSARASVGVGAARTVDARAQSYGAGIPLRARAHARTVVQTSVGASLELGVRARAMEVDVTTNRSVPPWESLPSASGDRLAADAAQRRRDGRRGR